MSSDQTQTILRDVGGVQIILGGAMIPPMLVAATYGEWHSALALLVSAVVAAGVGFSLYWPFRSASELGRFQPMVVAGAGWLLAACLGALPFLFAAYLTPAEAMESFVPASADYQSSLLYFRDPLHALFESMSGYTTTGLTMSIHEPSVGHGLLFYRSMMQWLGGAGMIVLSLAILRQPRGAAGMRLYNAEGRTQKLRPSIAETARGIWKIYVGLTLVVAVFLAVGTLVILPDYGVSNTIFDAVNHAMTGQSTGGFSTLDDSIAGYGSWAMELLHMPAMFLGAVSLPVYYLLLVDRDWKAVFRDTQTRFLGAVGVVGAVALTAFLFPWSDGVLTGHFLSDAGRFFGGSEFKTGVFQYVSALSTTGWQTAAIGNWEPGSVLFIVFCAMVIGGSAGATVGGIKIARFIVVLKGIAWEVQRTFKSRHEVVDFSLGQRVLTAREADEELRSAALFTLLYLLCLAGSILVLLTVIPETFSLADVIFEVASAQGTVGLSSGITGPDMPRLAEVVFIFQMWLGRLEIIPVFVMIRYFLRE